MRERAIHRLAESGHSENCRGDSVSSTGEPEVPDTAAGDSAEQRRAEEYLIARLSEDLGASLKKKEVELPGGEWLENDGVCETPMILCEAWAHQGPPKSAQKNKVLADSLKLIYVERLKSVPARKILLFGDKIAARRFQGENWMARALESFGIEIHIVHLPLEMRNALLYSHKPPNTETYTLSLHDALPIDADGRIYRG